MIKTSDLLRIVNSPVNWKEGVGNFLFTTECQEVRCDFDVIDNNTIELSRGNAINWRLAFDWGDENYLREFLSKISYGKKEIIKDESFLEKQKSIPRLQDDFELLKQLKEETSLDNEKGLWKNGFSSLCSFVCFRGVINRGYKESGIFQKGILEAIDMSIYPFCNWRGWVKQKKTYYDLEKNIKDLANIMRGNTIRKIYHWMYKYYEPNFTEKCFDNALSYGWRSRLEIEDLYYEKAHK